MGFNVKKQKWNQMVPHLHDVEQLVMGSLFIIIRGCSRNVESNCATSSWHITTCNGSLSIRCCSRTIRQLKDQFQNFM